MRATLIEGAIMQGRVAGIADFGAFVDLGAGVMGLVHVSELAHTRVTRVGDAVKVGDPLKEATEVGPQARADLRDELHEQVQQSLDKGAKCLLGGEVPDGDGAFYPPTVLTNVSKGMPAYDEELFGPVAAIITAIRTCCMFTP